jgi:hypothetical protein
MSDEDRHSEHENAVAHVQWLNHVLDDPDCDRLYSFREMHEMEEEREEVNAVLAGK